jgi:hypothetical protein
MNRHASHPPHPARRALLKPHLWLAAALGIAATVLLAGTVASATVDTSHNPVGNVEAISYTPTGVSISGWAADPDARMSTIKVAVFANGTRQVIAPADGLRVTPTAAERPYGNHHGYNLALPIATNGSYNFCVYGVNIGSGNGAWLGCLQRTVNHSPSGAVDPIYAVGNGQFSISGSAVDPNSTAPIAVAILADQQRIGWLTANQAIHGGHGFMATLPIAQGRHTVCADAVNVGPGANVIFGCQTFTIDDSPVGGFTALAQISNGIVVEGWSSDPNSPNPVQVTASIDGNTLGSMTANRGGYTHPNHNFAARFAVAAGGTRTVCLTATNIGPGSSRAVACQDITLNFDPSAAIAHAIQSRPGVGPGPGVTVMGWAADPDTTNPIQIAVTADGHALGTVTANLASSPTPGHGYYASFALPTNGEHTICVKGVNVGSGDTNAPATCSTVTLNFSPAGQVSGVTRAPATSNLAVNGWFIDPDTANPIWVDLTVDGTDTGRVLAGAVVPSLATNVVYGDRHGFNTVLTADPGEHRVCATGVNVSAGATSTPTCTIINAVHPVVPSAPQSVVAVPGYGSASVSWQAPASDGGAPYTSYTVTASPGGAHVTVPVSTTSASFTGLTPKAQYVFTVVATNVAGSSGAGRSPVITTQATPPPQTTPAPVSTSRYVRNIRSSASNYLTAMRAEGVADAVANPSGHSYLILLDIGGQDQADGGVVLSAGVTFVSYAALVANVESYIDGYASSQKASAPVTIAVGTNNDMDVSTISGAAWANTVIDPLVAYAHKYAGVTIAGANDIEPGFTASYAASRAWLSGYLTNTSAPFVFNGSADGCAWTVINGSCNNGYTAAGLYALAAGAAPTRIVNLPQIYNTTMPAQWKYISLTGVASRQPRINFGGPLTEWTACSQAGGCGSLTGVQAWQSMWGQLQSDPALRVGSLPYSTDLRIDR